MKRYFTLIVLLFAFIQISLASETRHTYNFGQPVITNSGSYQFIIFDNTLQTGLTGEPTLPYCKVSLLLPPGESATRIEYEWSEEATLPGTFLLYPQQQVRPYSEETSGEFLRNENLYSSNLSYPLNAGGQLVTSYMNGRSVAMSSFTPVRYNPANGKVTYFRSVTVNVISSPSSTSRDALKNLRTNHDIDKNIQRFTDNPDADASYGTDNVSVTGDYEILIITTSAYSNAFGSLITNYLKEGLVCQVETTEEINSSVTGLDLQEKIRNYIIAEYQQHGVEHVILGGDDELVPHRGFYCYVQSGSGYEDQNIPADLYYSALDGNWNSNGDNKWGEPGEDDLIPDISVGRMPFSNLIELNAMINKSVSYQFSPVMGEMRKVLMAGEELYGNPYTVGSQYLELLIGTHSDNGYTTTGIPQDYDFDKLYDETSYWSGSDLMAHLNQGNPMLNHSGHANETYVMKFSNSDITNANFSQVNGITHNFTLVYTHGCLCGAFDYNDCIAEKMVTINNFAAAFIGNSRYGWFNEGQTEGPSAHLHREFMDALYNDKYLRIGRAHMESKIVTMPWVTAPGQWEPGALRWCFYDCNVLGDPAMAVWTDNPFIPDVNYTQAIPVGSSSTSVTVLNNGQAVSDITCVIIKNGQLVGRGTTNTSGSASIVFDPVVNETGTAELYVSGSNCKPTSFPIEFISATGPYVVYQSVTVNDATGNQNGIPDFGETVSLSLTVQNLGQTDATNVMVKVTSTDPFISVTDSTELYPSVPSGSWVTIDNGFTFTVSDTIPDMHPITFMVTAISGTSWYSNFVLTAHAPQIVIGDLYLTNESLAVNGRLDPGETADLNIPVSNTGHSSCSDMDASLLSMGPYISVSNPSTNIGNIPLNGSQTAVFHVEVDPATPLYTLAELDFSTGIGDLVVEKQFYQLVGVNVEDFETGDFAKYNWTQGDFPWTISNVSPYEGSFSAKSGVISDSQSSLLSISMEVLGTDSISFYTKVSSESSFDYLRFFINQQEMEKWSGEIPWQRHSYPVTAGNKIFRWSYTKDFYGSVGSDCAWVDYIIFPAYRIYTGINVTSVSGLDLNLYPNPASNELNIRTSLPGTGHYMLTILAADGKNCYQKSLNTKDDLKIDVSGLKPGYYQCLVTDGVTKICRAFVIR